MVAGLSWRIQNRSFIPPKIRGVPFTFITKIPGDSLLTNENASRITLHWTDIYRNEQIGASEYKLGLGVITPSALATEQYNPISKIQVINVIHMLRKWNKNLSVTQCFSSSFS